MKRSFDDKHNLNTSNTRKESVLEGVVVAVSAIFDTNVDRKGKYWTALICDANQNVNRLTKYLSSKIPCRLHERIVESFNNKSGVRVTKLRFSGDYLYTACNETIVTPKVVSFTPSCTQNRSLEDIESMCNEEYVSFTCKVMDIGPERIQKKNFIQLCSVGFRMILLFSIMGAKKYKN